LLPRQIFSRYQILVGKVERGESEKKGSSVLAIKIKVIAQIYTFGTF
jgi:hypothetical protein